MHFQRVSPIGVVWIGWSRSQRQSAKTADWLENNDVKWLFSRNCACANSKDSKWSRQWSIEVENNTLAFFKFCGKLDDSYPGCQRNFFFKVGENTQRFQISGRGHTIDYFASLHVSMSSSNASSCIILLVLATVNFLDMGVGLPPDYLKILQKPANWQRNSSLFSGTTGATWSWWTKGFCFWK